MINREDVFTKKDIPWRVIEGEAILVDVTKGGVLQLNEVAAFAWDNIDGQRNIGQIIAGVCEEFDVKEDRAVKDIEEYFEELLKRKLVEKA